jgi:TonB family protein
MSSALFKLLAVVFVLAATLRPACAQQRATLSSIDRVKKLYETAAYDEALGELDQILQQDSTPAQARQGLRAVQQYRALCLLALGRTVEAEQAIDRMVAADPDYQPDPNETAPRLVSMFYRARSRVVPMLARSEYERGRSLYDRHQYAEAVAEFTSVIARLDDSNLDASTAAATGDLRVLASGFLELSRAALLPARTIPLMVMKAAEVAPAPVERIWTDQDRDVTPPVSISQDLPKWTHQPVGLERRFEGQVDVVVNERGEVDSVTLAKSIHPSYDDLAVAAAKSWKYSPATRDGAPVKFRKSVGILLFVR